MAREPSPRARARTTRRCSPAARRPRPSCSTPTRRRSRRRCSSSPGCPTGSCSSCGPSGRRWASATSPARSRAATGRASRGARVIGVKAILAAPLFLPFAVALLFGNLDAWYPLLYGALVLAAFPTSGRWTWLAAGAAVAVVAIAKLHPAVLGLWLLVRVFADRDGPWRTVLARGRRHGRRDPRGEPAARRGPAVAGLRGGDPGRRGRGARGPAEPRAGVAARAGDGAGRPGAAGRAGRS